MGEVAGLANDGLLLKAAGIFEAAASFWDDLETSRRALPRFFKHDESTDRQPPSGSLDLSAMIWKHRSLLVQSKESSMNPHEITRL
jgi:hypothetical protein